jgi:hypothetical protein
LHLSLGLRDSPVNGSVPFAHDDTVDTCCFFNSLNDYINSWNSEEVDLNGIDITNTFVTSKSFPAPIDGGYCLCFQGNYFWSHIEVR